MSADITRVDSADSGFLRSARPPRRVQVSASRSCLNLHGCSEARQRLGCGCGASTYKANLRLPTKGKACREAMEPGGGIRPEQNGLSDAAVYCKLLIPEIAGSNPVRVTPRLI